MSAFESLLRSSNDFILSQQISSILHNESSDSVTSKIRSLCSHEDRMPHTILSIAYRIFCIKDLKLPQAEIQNFLNAIELQEFEETVLIHLYFWILFHAESKSEGDYARKKLVEELFFDPENTFAYIHSDLLEIFTARDEETKGEIVALMDEIFEESTKLEESSVSHEFQSALLKFAKDLPRTSPYFTKTIWLLGRFNSSNIEIRNWLTEQAQGLRKSEETSEQWETVIHTISNAPDIQDEQLIELIYYVLDHVPGRGFNDTTIQCMFILSKCEFGKKAIAEIRVNCSELKGILKYFSGEVDEEVEINSEMQRYANEIFGRHGHLLLEV